MGYRRKNTKNADAFINGLLKVGTGMAAAYKREEKAQQRAHAAYNRLLVQQERERVRQIKQHDMAIRRAERELQKAQRELEKQAKLEAKLQEQQRIEANIADIEDNNYLWTNVQSFIGDIITEEKINNTLSQCNYEQLNEVRNGFFKTEYPDDYLVKQQAQKEANNKYDVDEARKEAIIAKEEYDNYIFDEVEPTIESVSQALEIEAKDTISALLPWKQSKLRKAYVLEHQETRYKEKHMAWEQRASEYERRKKELLSVAEEKERVIQKMREEKKDYYDARFRELFDEEIKKWKEEQEEFYNTLRQSLQNVVDGDKEYIIPAIDSLFPDENLPMDFFVDFAYDESNGKILIDLDLPEIEDIPDQKIVLTSTGKKSIRLKGQTDLRTDYVHCIFGLAAYVAFAIFNISLKIKNVEISGFTQRKEKNSAVATDQYVFVVDFSRDLFSTIDFSKLSALQVMDLFPRHFNMTKGYELKQIDLSKAYDEMEAFIPENYNNLVR